MISSCLQKQTSMGACDDADDAQEQIAEPVQLSKAEQDSKMGSMDKVPEERSLDENKAKNAMASFSSSQQAGKEAAKQRERELAAVKVAKEDVELVAHEFEVDKKLAERRLKENAGSLSATLSSFI